MSGAPEDIGTVRLPVLLVAVFSVLTLGRGAVSPAIEKGTAAASEADPTVEGSVAATGAAAVTADERRTGTMSITTSVTHVSGRGGSGHSSQRC